MQKGLISGSESLYFTKKSLAIRLFSSVAPEIISSDSSSNLIFSMRSLTISVRRSVSSRTLLGYLSLHWKNAIACRFLQPLTHYLRISNRTSSGIKIIFAQSLSASLSLFLVAFSWIWPSNLSQKLIKTSTLENRV